MDLLLGVINATPWGEEGPFANAIGLWACSCPWSRESCLNQYISDYAPPI